MAAKYLFLLYFREKNSLKEFGCWTGTKTDD